MTFTQVKKKKKIDYNKPDAKAQRKPKGRFINALSRDTEFDFAFSAQLITFGFELLGAFASLRETGFGFSS
jgi:hypothetical protein